MLNRLRAAFLLMLLPASLVAAGAGEEPVRIAAAASLRPVLPALIDAYRESPEGRGEAIEAVYASSGKLYAQIRAGAPYDLYLAADERYPRRLAEAGLGAGAVEVYARGTLVCAARCDDFPAGRSAEELADWLAGRDGKIAVANGELAPYGRAYAGFFAAFGARLPAALDPGRAAADSRLVVGENVSQTWQFFVTGGTDCAFVPLAQVLAAGERFSWTAVDEEYAGELRQAGLPLLRDGAQAVDGPECGVSRAGGFWRFLLSESGRALLRRGGYR